MTARARMVEKALAVVGYSAAPPSDAYLGLVGPDEDERLRREMLKMSGCALVARGLLRSLGVAHERLGVPYRPGKAVADVFAIARDAGAWVDGHADAVPSPGDIAILTGPEHVCIVLEVRADADALRVVSCDGGQKDANGVQCVQQRERTWRRRASEGWVASSPGTSRKVLGWADIEKVLAAFGTSEEDVYPRG